MTAWGTFYTKMTVSKNSLAPSQQKVHKNTKQLLTDPELTQLAAILILGISLSHVSCLSAADFLVHYNNCEVASEYSLN